MKDTPETVVCLSHLRWGFVYQRPNHLMTRCALSRPVLFVEEPVHHDGAAELALEVVAPGVTVVTPRLPPAVPADVSEVLQRRLLEGLLRERGVRAPWLWFYTPMALPLASGLAPSLVVYDCMDELSAFAHAPPALRERERALMERADLVFTGGQSLYEARRDRHPAVHAFPSSVDAAHFGRALDGLSEPDDQRDLPRPRVGFFGVIDERMDLDLLARLADARPSCQIVMVGPVVKIDPASLPRRPNLHWLGPKPYAALPAYLAGWDAAIMPFALNDSTRFISPTKTLEYLAAGRPVVSTAVRDVVRPYGERGLVAIADADGFPRAVDEALAADGAAHRRAAAEVVGATSWDKTWRAMARLMEQKARAGAEEATTCSTI